MDNSVLLALASILVAGVLSQYIAWRLKFPSILLLLVAGLVMGPATGFLDPDALFGDVLFPSVSFAVAIILFEGGLSLKVQEWRETSRQVRRLVSTGLLITWVLATLLSRLLLDLSWSLATLFGAILTVTGPTVVLPLMLLIRPKGQVNSILKWEGILNDPIGALLALLVFEAIIAVSLADATAIFAFGFVLTLFAGGLLGLLAGMLVTLALKHHWIPEFLANTFTLAVVLTLYTVSNLIQHESGLFSVTIMGIYLGNQRLVSIRGILGFKEDLRVILLSSLFIMLAARTSLSDWQQIHLGSLLFLAALIFLVRPAAVFISTYGSPLNWKEKTFISAMAPRGIVAAAVTSLFAVKLQEMGFAGAETLAPTMFLIIVGTITFYGLLAGPLARRLSLADANPQGCIFLGSNRFTRALAAILQKEGFSTLIIDARWAHIKEARMEGLKTVHGNILSGKLIERLDLTGVSRFLGMTGNLELNALACLRFIDLFGVQEVYQLADKDEKDRPNQWVPDDLSGNTLFHPAADFSRLIQRLNHGASIKRTPLTRDFTYDDYLTQNASQEPLPLCLITEQKGLLFFRAKTPLTPQPGNTLISLVGGV